MMPNLPNLMTGAHRQYLQAYHELLYAARFNNLGATATIINLCDLPDAPTATTFTTRVSNASGSSQTATWATAPNAFGTPFSQVDATLHTSSGLHGPAGIPLIRFGGVDAERLTIPDVAYWTRALATFSVITCGIMVNAAANQDLMAKDDSTTAREWFFYLDNSELLTLDVYDNTAGVAIRRASDAAVPLNVPVHLCITHDGAANMTGSVVYVNGAAVASTATNDVNFVTMRDTAIVVTVGSDADAAVKYNLAGGLHGGPFGPTFVQAQLTAAQVLNDYRLYRGALGIA